MNFQQELEQLINKHRHGDGSGTTDPVLAEYLTACLAAYSPRRFEEARDAAREFWAAHPPATYELSAPAEPEETR